ncbi:hypothetical protein WMF38_01165 [Sorangium sp. So ce118]
MAIEENIAGTRWRSICFDVLREQAIRDARADLAGAEHDVEARVRSWGRALRCS